MIGTTERSPMADHSYFDLHVHSTDGSDDAGATVEGYCKWVEARRKNGYHVDGFVLTEHRHYLADADYSALAQQYDLTILRGIEVETDAGHVLVYGVTPTFLERFDLSDIALPYAEVFRAAEETGGIAVGAHAGRPRIGLVEHVGERGVSLETVGIIEALNGGSSDYENGRSFDLAEQHGLLTVGGSDSHFISALGRCLTEFDVRVTSNEELVSALRSGQFRPLRVEDTREGAQRKELPSAAHIPSTSGQGELGGDAIEMDKSVIGEEVHAGALEVTLESIANYCEALEETNPLYTDAAWAESEGPYSSIIAPPGILNTAQLRPGPDPQVRFGDQSFMAGSRLETFSPIKPGDTIDAFTQVKEVYEKTGRSGRMVFIVRRTRYANQDGIDVAATESSSVMRQVKALDD
jgi:acyl dehydratase/predicted metal-dependent phosphoesterase TrpH